MTHYKRATCRVCDGRHLRLFLSLGPTPLANAFLHSAEEFASEPRYPLDVYYCETCTLVQLLDVIDPRVLFRDYIYVTGTSDTIAAHNEAYARDTVALLGLDPGDLVVEAASNDGSLLKCFQAHHVRTLGVEPAANIARLANAAGVETIEAFFDLSTARAIGAAHGQARAVIGNNVLGHVDQAQEFLRSFRHLLAPGGLAIVEVPYVRDLIDRLEYDTIYHEHLSYFSVGALMRLCDAAGLSIVRVERVPVHGGSLRLYARAASEGDGHAPAVQAIAREERAAGLHDFACYEQFACHVAESRGRLVSLLEGLKQQGKSLAAYGAPAKGNMLLNYCGIDARMIPYTVDKSPLKVGLLTPGMHIPVLPVAALLDRQPDCVLILAWNFSAEIVRQQQAYQARGGRFIVPIPEPRLLGQGELL